MRSAYRAFTSPGPVAPAPFRRHARADAFRGLPAFPSLSMAGSEWDKGYQGHWAPQAGLEDYIAGKGQQYFHDFIVI
ncbi:MAG: hypothetical protein WAT23_05595 [Chromatiaceae bacterium]